MRSMCSLALFNQARSISCASDKRISDSSEALTWKSLTDMRLTQLAAGPGSDGGEICWPREEYDSRRRQRAREEH